MIRTMLSTFALVFALSLVARAEEAPPAEPKKDEGTKEEPKKDEGTQEEKIPEGDPKALKALQDGVNVSVKKKYTLRGTMEVESNGSPFMTIELNGEHAGKYTHYKTEIMGRPMEVFTDGESTVSLDPQSGEWQLQSLPGGGKGRGGMRGGLSMDQVVQTVKSAKFDGEKKVGSHECTVVRAYADVESIRKLLGGGKVGGQGTVKKSSLKFYVDKKDGRLRRMKLSMDASANMGGNAMDITFTSDYRYTYKKDLQIEIPEAAKAALEGKPAQPEEKKEEPKGEAPKDDGQPKDGDKK